MTPDELDSWADDPGDALYGGLYGCGQRPAHYNECAPTIMQPDNALLASARDTYEKCLAVLQTKNADYATVADPFANFRTASVVGVDPARAILVRIMDKIARISNLLAQPAQNESLEDSCDDAINYFAILKAFVSSGR